MGGTWSTRSHGTEQTDGQDRPVHLVPVLLGEGRRLFDSLGPDHIASGDLAGEIAALKREPGKDLIAWGGGGLRAVTEQAPPRRRIPARASAGRAGRRVPAVLRAHRTLRARSHRSPALRRRIGTPRLPPGARRSVIWECDPVRLAATCWLRWLPTWSGSKSRRGPGPAASSMPPMPACSPSGTEK